ncbi:hypothetical protein MIND_00459500 [Mycena indigotica]|uniref:Tubulin-tyrosine ligase n=1 Tax=Mycena indigotica TaxID=2126181 RepID=A0A8H6W9J2_9AGAR|nr:uncharacterized protein MIND_00459500 [Mycena indigotica]KAF7306678.1 hypothetical protein MIND_00459500 [Mycena indigotica]
MYSAIVHWPSAPVTKSLVLKSLSSLTPPIPIVDSPDQEQATLFWSTYDEIDHELVHSRRTTVLSSCYTFRKALIRKHFLSRCISQFIAKNPQSPLKAAAPRTYEIELSFLDELDEMFVDELWELGKELEEKQSWWILKPGMADRGNGVRMFNSRAALERIFEEFEEAEDDDDDDQDSTAVVASQLRHFVIQEYLSNPLLLDPLEALSDKPQVLVGRKFHLRVYCVAAGALKVYFFHKILALFAATPYTQPSVVEDEDGDPLPIDLSSHLTNTSLQTEKGDENVRLLEELVSCHILSDDSQSRLSEEDMKNILDQIAVILADTFRAAVQVPTHFQPVPNSFELFGVDFLVTHSPSLPNPYQVALLEVNAEPSIELTGPRLSWILEDLFIAVGKACVDPFFTQEITPWPVGETREGLIKCLEMELGM